MRFIDKNNKIISLKEINSLTSNECDKLQISIYPEEKNKFDEDLSNIMF